MNSSGISAGSPIQFKSKKMIQSTPKGKKSVDPIATQTPDKHPCSELPIASRRLRNRGLALSVKEIRKVASASSDHQRPVAYQEKDQAAVKSVRRQIVNWPEEKPASRWLNSRNAPDDGPTKIPEKYEMLGEFFDGLDSSIRLSRLKGLTTTFTNICSKIECLTDRRFSLRHLAQLKHVLPEAIEIKRVLMFDERTSCMKPDLQITLNADAIESHGKLKSESKNMHLRKIFRTRLVEFHKSHPEGDDVPEEMLPEPFNGNVTKAPISSSLVQLSSDAHTSQNLNSSMPVTREIWANPKPAKASHFSQNFQRRFSQKVEKIGVEGTLESSSSPCLEQSVCASSAAKTMPSHLATPIKQADQQACEAVSASKMAGSDSTPMKPASTSVPMSNTPALCPPKRSCMSPEDMSTSSPNKLVRRPVRTRSLKFDTSVKTNADEPDEFGQASPDDDLLNIFPGDLLESIREKERKAKEERDPAISQAKRRRQMIAGLPKLFNMIHFLFQLLKRSVLTKDELMFKIIASHSDIVDRREVEEQLNLLLELVPEWISTKLASSGDHLICINKLSSPEIVRACLEEAK